MSTLENMAKAINKVVNEAGKMKKAKRKQQQRQTQQNTQNSQQNTQGDQQNAQGDQQNTQPQVNVYQNELSELTDTLKGADKGDNLHFGIREMPLGSERDDENSISNSELVLTVIDAVSSENLIRCILFPGGSNGDRASEYEGALGKSEVFINTEESLKIVGEQIQMDVALKLGETEDDYVIRDIFYLLKNQTTPTDDDEGGETTISRDKFREKILNDPDLNKSRIHKQNMFNTLANASPTGLHYLQQQVDKEKLDNA